MADSFARERVHIGIDCGVDQVVVIIPLMSVTCCCCGAYFGVKNGRGVRGETSTICGPCVQERFPDLAGEFKRRRADSGAAAWGLVPDYREPLRESEIVFREVGR